MTLAILAGLAFGSGLWLVVTGLRPLAPDLAWALARSDRPSEEMHTLRDRLEASPAISDLTSPLAEDLAVLELGRFEAVMEVGGYILAGLVLPVIAAVLSALSIYRLSWTIPFWFALLSSGVAATVAVNGIRRRATSAREELISTLGAVLDLCALGLATGRGLEAAILRSTAQGSQPAMLMLRHSIEDAQRFSRPIWAGFEALGRRTGVSELGDLAASLQLAGQDGARVREAMAAKARSIRTRKLADAEAQANRMTEQIQVPLSLLAVGLLVLLLYPAVVAVGGS